MKLDVESMLAQIFNKFDEDLCWDEDMIRTEGPGHTREVSELPYTHIGRLNAQYYAVSTVFSAIEEEKGLKILNELSKLQVKDEDSEQRGGFRWYREETAIRDTNAAFFIIMPLVFLRLYYPDKIPSSHIPVLDEMMLHSFYWFQKECAHSILYYPNKIISDGAMLLGISKILRIQQGLKEGIKFFKRWEEYTERRGWGWGENLSFVYLAVILNALQLSRKALGEQEPALGDRLQKRIEHAIEYARFHGGKEMVPTIRSYNFDGNENVYGWLNVVTGVRFSEKDVWGGTERPLITIINLKMFKEYLDRQGNITYTESDALLNEGECKKKCVQPCTRIESIFDDTFAYTWIGREGRLGSINRYPVIPGCYQWPTWGLGWQSMPVAFLVESEQFSFLRFGVNVGNNLRTHPALDKHKAYLDPALFREEYLPTVTTYCSQNENLLLAIRSICSLNNTASEIMDSWTINRFKGELKEYKIESDGTVRQWIVLKYERASVAVSCLNGIKIGDTEASPSRMEVIEDNGNLDIRQVLYRGEEKLLQQHRIEAGWAVVFVDEILEDDKMEEFLTRIEIADKNIYDYEVPRTGYTMIRDVCMSLGGKLEVGLKYDPHYMK